MFEDYEREDSMNYYFEKGLYEAALAEAAYYEECLATSISSPEDLDYVGYYDYNE